MTILLIFANLWMNDGDLSHVHSLFYFVSYCYKNHPIEFAKKKNKTTQVTFQTFQSARMFFDLEKRPCKSGMHHPPVCLYGKWQAWSRGLGFISFSLEENLSTGSRSFLVLF